MCISECWSGLFAITGPCGQVEWRRSRSSTEFVFYREHMKIQYFALYSLTYIISWKY